MKSLFRISGVILVVLSIFLIHSCKKDKPTPPIITTTAASAITQTTATAGGNLTSDGGASVTARGVCWSTTTGPTTALSTKTTDNTRTGIFTSAITGLTSGTTYYVKAYATNSAGTAYGNEISFTTTSATIPVLTTTAASSITQTTAKSGGNVTSDGGATVTARGVCWSTTTGPTTALSTKTTDGTGTGIFTSSITALTAGTVYYVRAYATNGAGTVYGNEVSFKTSATTLILTTTSASLITSTTASTGGNISTDGGAAVTARGVCWSTSANPTIALSTKTTDGTGTGSFNSSITGLIAGTTYYVRAYSVNSAGTAYGNEIIFTTKGLPSIETTVPFCISNSTAASGGYIANEGGAAVTARGVCWSTTQNPTTSNSKTIDGTGISYFTSSITGLAPGTTYYIRAYATNSIGTAYGVQVIATTNVIQPIAKKYLALVSVVNSWLNYEDNSWEGVYPVKENDNIQIFQVCIWNIANPKVSLYKFDRTWPKIFAGGQAYVDYRESFNILNVEIPNPSSQAYLNAFKLIMEKIVKMQPLEHFGIDYKGHGTGGSGLFENKISGDDSEILLSYINSLLGKKIDYLDWNTNCAQGNFDRVLGEYKYADYILGSDLDRGEFDYDGVDYYKFRPEAIYETFFLPSKSIRQCLVDMTNSIRLFWETTKAKNDMISNKVKQSISIYDSNKFEDFINSTNLKSSTYSGDVLNYVKQYYPSQEQKFMDFRFYYVSNKDFFLWDIDSNGFVKY